MSLPRHPAIVALLTPPSLLYATAVRLRNRFYDRPSAAVRASLPVLSVGNLSVGGTGKTPLVAWLVGQLGRRGLRAAVVSRGYGGRAGSGPIVVSRGNGSDVAADCCGDEPFMLASRLRGSLVIVGSDRVRGAEAAAAEGADVVVLDDGFQHRRLHRDFDLVVLDGTRDPSAERMLPAGSLREPLSALRRADAVVVTRLSEPSRLDRFERLVRRHNARAVVVRAVNRAVGFYDRHGERCDAPRRALAFCAIGNPDSFRADLETERVELAGFVPFSDHHVYRAAELRDLEQRAAALDADLLTTEKDLARLTSSEHHFSAPPAALRIEPEIHEPAALLRALDSVLKRGPA